jgi:hypothetical protein
MSATVPSRADVARLTAEVEAAYRAGQRKPVIRLSDYPTLTADQAVKAACFLWRQHQDIAAWLSARARRL